MSLRGHSGIKVLSVLAVISLMSVQMIAGRTNFVWTTEEYVRRIYTRENGLPDNQVQCLLQSRDGYIWVGTHRGLARFDGLKFAVSDRSNMPGLTSDDFQFLAEDAQGSVWASTRAEVLRIQDGHCERFGPEAGLPQYQTHLLLASQRGCLWIGSGRGLSRLDGSGIVTYGAAEGLESSICSLEEDLGGALWVGEEKSLKLFEPNTGRFSTNFKPKELGPTFPQIIKRDHGGNMWVAFMGTEECPGADAPIIRQWVRWFANGRWSDCPGNPQSNDGRPFFFLPDHDDNMWMPARFGRVARFRSGELQYFPLVREGETTYAQCALADREGNLWFGTEAGGLQRWSPRKVEVWSGREGLAHDNTWTIGEGHDGSVWIGSDGGLSRIQAQGVVNFGEREGLSRKEVRSVAEDQAGTIWVGTMSGLFSFRDGVFQKHEFPGKWFEGKIRALLASRDGGLWVGTAAGLHRLVEGVQTKYSTTNGLAHDEVRALLEDRAGNLWIGMAGGGLQCLRDGRFTSFTRTNGLGSDNAWALHEDADGVVWIGTDMGLSRWERGRFTTITTREGLPDNLINCILEDDFGRFWISHDRGIYWVWRKDLNDVAAGRIRTVRCISYDESDGLPSLETNGQKSNPAGCKTRDGRLWFPTTKGVAVVDPRKAAFDAVPPLAAIELVRANGSLLLDARLQATGDVAADSRTSDAVRIDKTGRQNFPPPTLNHRLPPGGARVLEFRYTANTFLEPEKVRFKYRLRGLDDHWIDAGTRREAYFADLRPGDYQFEIIAANHHGVWQEQGATFAFHLSPFLYQTWWFYLGCGVATIGLVAGLVVWRLRELRRIHRLEQAAAITAERTRIAKDLHDGLGADLTRLTMLADLAGGEPGTGSGDHLKKLSQSSRAAARELKEIIWIANPANDTVEGLVSRICQSAEDFLRDAQVRCRFEVASHLPAQTLTIEQRRNLLLVAREALNNIVKHAGATEVTIGAKGGGAGWQLTIQDNGRGFDPASARPDGLGLASMRRRVESLGGSFELESRVGAGTRILITVKLSQPP